MEDALTQRKQRMLERALDRGEELLEKFDAEADVAFKTLQSIHRNVNEKGAARIAAAVSILERASIAPRRKSDDATAATAKVIISKIAMERVKEAFHDLGDVESVELVEGEYVVDGDIVPKEAP